MALLPGIIISQTFPDARGQRGGVARAIRNVLRQQVLGMPVCCIHMPDLLDPADLPEVAQVLREHKVTAVYCITRALNEAGVNLSSGDAENRAAAVRVAKAQVLHARTVGAAYMDVIGGARPVDGKRGAALPWLLDSLLEITRFAREEAPGLRIQIEPLDHNADKRNTLGTAAEGARMCEEIAAAGETLGLCLDSAHMGLNEEDITAGIWMAAPYLTEFHFCNCCAQPGHPLMGDRHIAPGAPGLFGMAEYRMMARTLDTLPQDVMVFPEVLKPDNTSEEEQLAACLKILEVVK